MMKTNTTSNYVLEERLQKLAGCFLFISISIKMTHTEKSDTSDEKVDIENNKFNFSKEPVDIINVIIEYRYYYKISILLEKVLLSTLLVIKFKKMDI